MEGPSRAAQLGRGAGPSSTQEAVKLLAEEAGAYADLEGIAASRQVNQVARIPQKMVEARRSWSAGGESQPCQSLAQVLAVLNAKRWGLPRRGAGFRLVSLLNQVSQGP